MSCIQGRNGVMIKAMLGCRARHTGFSGAGGKEVEWEEQVPKPQGPGLLKTCQEQEAIAQMGADRRALALQAPCMTRREDHEKVLLMGVCSLCLTGCRWKVLAQVSEWPVGKAKGLRPVYPPFSTECTQPRGSLGSWENRLPPLLPGQTVGTAVCLPHFSPLCLSLP